MHVMDESPDKAAPAADELPAEGAAAAKRCREPPPAADKENTAPVEQGPASPANTPSPRLPQAAAAADDDDKELHDPAVKLEKTEDAARTDVKENGDVDSKEQKPSSPETSPADADKKCADDGAKAQSEPSLPPSPGGGDDDRSSPGAGGGKRGSSDSDSDTPAALKKAKMSKLELELEERERAVSEYVESAAGTSVDELQRCSAKLRQEISALDAMARAKEQEWNSIVRLKKVKEEMYLRLQRKRQVMLIMMGRKPTDTMDWDPFCKEQGVPDDALGLSKSSGKQGAPQQQFPGAAGVSVLKSGQHLMMVPIVSSTPSHLSRSVTITTSSSSQTKLADSAKDRRGQRPILPKPTIVMSGAGGNGQNPVIGEGRQGTILDVRSIIADYRSRHPEMVPRRGRRLKSSLSPTPSQQSAESLVSSTRLSGGSGGVFSMASLALGSGSQMRAADLGDLGFLAGGDVSRQDASSRPSSADSSRSGAPPQDPGPGFSFKDVLVQFAKLSQAEQGGGGIVAHPSSAGGKAAPPYPEVTLHPVLATQHSPPHASPSSSLLHGILTKSAQRPSPDKPTTFSPTLARLLTAPERVPGSVVAAMPTSTFHNVGHVSINDLLASSKGRSEVTITPVSNHPPVKTKEEVVLLEEDEQEDSVDRLVIDESGEMDGRRSRAGADLDAVAAAAGADMASDEVPECQGCHRRAAQFVCAGCGNQWYCSRDCQVNAWDEHSEVCSG